MSCTKLILSGARSIKRNQWRSTHLPSRYPIAEFRRSVAARELHIVESDWCRKLLGQSSCNNRAEEIHMCRHVGCVGIYKEFSWRSLLWRRMWRAYTAYTPT